MCAQLRAVASQAQALRVLTLHRGLRTQAWLAGVGGPCPLPPSSCSPFLCLQAPELRQALMAHTGKWDHGTLTRMGPTSAQIQALERAAVAGVQGHRAGEVELVQGHGAVEYVLWRQGHSHHTGVLRSLLPWLGFFPSPVLQGKSFSFQDIFLGS